MAKGRTLFQREVDDKLTQEFNNQLPVRQFILDKIAQLTQYLQLRYGGNVRIFIKGGSALNLLRESRSKMFGTTETWSDFDNQIIINPNLPIDRWYDVHRQIHTYLKQEFLPCFQKEWDLFLSYNRKEYSPKQQQGLDSFKATLIPNTILDFPRYQFLLESDIHGALKSCKVDTAYDFGANLKEKRTALNLTLEKTSQSNMVFSAGMELMHPLNHFDTAMSLANIAKLKVAATTDLSALQDKLEKDGINNDALFFNSYFPPTSVVLDDSVASNEAPDSSSILLNASISKFYLYRIIVRYANHDYFNDGKAKSIGKKEWFSTDQKAFDKGLRAKFRGELIDVSIPRRDSEETIQQWQQVNTHTIQYFSLPYIDNKVNKDTEQGLLQQGHKGYWLNVPDWDYQLNENILLILEVFIDISGSPHKFWKRVKRATDAVKNIYTTDPKAKESKELKFDKNKTLFLAMNSEENLDFMRPLIQDIDAILINDYNWNWLKLGSEELKKLDNLYGEKLDTQVTDNWNKHIKTRQVNGQNYDDILNDKITQQTERTQCQKMLGFMLLYKQLHDGFKNAIEFKAQNSAGKYDVQYLNDFRVEVEKKAAVPCTFGGIFSAFIDTRLKQRAHNQIDYYLPFIELFIIADKKEQNYKKDQVESLKLDSMSAQMNSEFVENDNYSLFDDSGDGYYRVTLKEFKLPVLVWVIHQPEGELTTLFKQKLDKLDKIGNTISKLTVEITNIQQSLNTRYCTLTQEERSQLVKQLRETKEKIDQTIIEQRKERRQSQLMQVFNPNSSQISGRRNSANIRHLKGPEAVKHMDIRIANSRSFYMTHWLDHIRTEYKDSITKFR